MSKDADKIQERISLLAGTLCLAHVDLEKKIEILSMCGYVISW